MVREPQNGGRQCAAGVPYIVENAVETKKAAPLVLSAYD
jgi:hypothetical protein